VIGSAMAYGCRVSATDVKRAVAAAQSVAPADSIDLDPWRASRPPASY